MTAIEELRRSYRPSRVTALFVGESAPAGETFFYSQNSHLYRGMKKAFGEDDNFLKDFKNRGFYLEDLVDEPINHQDKSLRRARRNSSIPSLAERIKLHQPEVIVVVMCAIKPMVTLALEQSGVSCKLHCVPFPAFGQQGRFHKVMTEIIPKLP